MKRFVLAFLAFGCIDDIDVGSRTTFFGGDLPRSWKSFESPVSDLLYGIDGASANAIWAVGERGVILRFDGANWRREESPVADDLYAVYAASTDSVWAAGDGGALVHYDGVRWSRVGGVVPEDIGGGPARLVDVAGSSRNDIWVLPESLIDFGEDWAPAALHFAGTWSVFQRPESDGLERALTVGKAGDAWALTGAGVQRYLGSAWIDVGPPTSDLLFSFEDAFADEQGRLWALGYDIGGSRPRAFRYDGVWRELEGEGIEEESLHLFAIGGAGEELVAAGDGSHLARFDGTVWRTLIEGSFAEPNLLDVTIVEGRIWAVGARGAIVRAE